ncbi:MAG: iron-sulfur cluster assembly protein [Proteobacteria bacterium]|nr:iron-sulfur cluster assembly protein [Pseudomonadota bacterium]
MPADRVSEVLARLATVNDPELDESVVELDFVTDIAIAEDGAVSIAFRLPTYWCAANFAFLMAEDMRSAVATLPWVTRVSVTLGEHMYAETINRGMAETLSFQTAFGAEADGNLAQVRRTFLVKAFQRRQVALADHLLAAGHAPETLAAVSLAELRSCTNTAEGQALVQRYLDRRSVVGDADEAAPAFVDEHGAPVPSEKFRSHMRALRRVAVNVEFNGALCRGLLAARFNETREDDEPTLLDFIRAVPKEKRAPLP